MAYTGKKPVNHTDVTQSQSMTVTDDLTVDTDTLHVDSANDRVGVGTTSPSSTASIIGTGVNGLHLGQQADNTGNSARLFYDNSTNIWTTYSTTGSFKIASGATIGTTSGTDRLVINSSGNVGIGTSSPDRLLTLQGDNSYMWIKDAGGGNTAFIGSDGSNDGFLRIYDSSHTAKVEIESDGNSYFNGGNVGIGTSSPNALLDIEDTAPTIRLTDDRDITWSGNEELGVIEFHNSDSSGNGSHLTGFIKNIQSLTGGSTQVQGELAFGVAAYNTAATERMRIDSAGRVLFKTTSATNTGAGVRINGTAASSGSLSNATASGAGRIEASGTGNGFQSFMNLNMDSSTATGVISFQKQASVKGSIQWGTTTSYNTTSDYRLKENVVDITDGITRVKQLDPKRFNFIGETDTVDGFLAHEAQTVVPEAVHGTHNEVETWTQDEIDAGDAPANTSAGDNKVDDEGNTIPIYQGIDQAKLVPLLTAALQEAITKIEALETENADFETRIAALEAN